LVAFCISSLTSTGGVTGAFILLPFAVSVLGFTSPAVSPTNLLYNVVAIPSGVWRFHRERRMLWTMAWATAIGTLPGLVLGAWIRLKYLPDPRAFKLFAGFVLLYLGGKLLFDIVRKRKQQNNGSADRSITGQHFDLGHLSYDYQGETFSVTTWPIIVLSLVVGVVGGIYGIGGGSIIAPFFVTFFGLPVYTVAGAALMGTFVTSMAGVAFYQAIAFFYPNMSVAPDWLLGFLFGLGGMAGMYLGARCQKFVPSKAIKWMLAVIILFTSIKYLAAFFGY